MASGMSKEFLTHEDVLKVGRMAADDLSRLVKETIKKIRNG
jgi:purine nucleoside phosphorylase